MDPENSIEATGTPLQEEAAPGETIPQEETQHEPQSEGHSPEEAADTEPRSFIAEWTVTILLLLFGTTFILQAYVIPTGSMEDTLLVGDHLLVDKLAFAPPGTASRHLLPYSEPHRGDIIVFRYPVDISQTFVKRCIGVPGDRIRLVDKNLILNGKAVNEPYVVHKAEYFDPYRDEFPMPNIHVPSPASDMLRHHVVNGEVVVPPGYYFAMGDNRDLSSDSRYWGFVPRANIIGKPLVIYWSYDANTDDLTNTAISAHHIFDLLEHFPTKTRWKRTFRLIHSYPLE
ncbi:MAG TPA: signal peptidase I [Bryobacteraceae bacterium]|nr:signal peptidase I [Bryobacteraceae bacterium]